MLIKSRVLKDFWECSNSYHFKRNKNRMWNRKKAQIEAKSWWLFSSGRVVNGSVNWNCFDVVELLCLSWHCIFNKKHHIASRSNATSKKSSLLKVLREPFFFFCGKYYFIIWRIISNSNLKFKNKQIYDISKENQSFMLFKISSLKVTVDIRTKSFQWTLILARDI